MTEGAQLAEAALRESRAEATVVLVDETYTANLRWANNTLTTNGTTHAQTVTVIAMCGGAAGSVRRTGLDAAGVAELAGAAERAARANPPAEDAGELVDGGTDDDFAAPAQASGPAVLREVAKSLGEQFETAAGAGRRLYGFANHEVSTLYLATSSGTRRRYVTPTGTIDVTGRPADGSASAWSGRATRDFTDVDVGEIVGEVAQRLDWSARRVALPAGRYETILPPSATADLLAELYWAMSARGAHEGRTAFAKPGGGTRLGEAIASAPVSLRSDPGDPELGCAPFVAAAASSEFSSVFDNGMPLEATDWIRDGRLEALLSTRHTARLSGLPVRPPVDNLLFQAAGTAKGLDEMVADTGRGLLLTCLWYIREVDPETLLVTGLTRDGVFLVEGGEVVGVVNNFRFNESPLGLLSRIAEVGPTARTLPREFQEYLPRVAAPALRVPDFHMSSVSQAS